MVGHQRAASDVPEDRSSDVRGTRPCPELIESWLGDAAYDVEPVGPGKGSAVPVEDPQAQAAARHFRDVLGRFASGVTVVTTVSDDEPVGMTCQSFSSVSLDPPLVLFVPAKTSRVWPLVQRSGRFCVNFLAAEQAELSNRMAGRDVDRFAGVAWHPSEVSGSPVLEGTLAHIDCSVHAVHEAGDHWVVIGRVLDLQVSRSGGEDPLIFYRGQYRTAG
jgi:3-hydroxy-9,10-secoandrosta-1,3,5(10)-triene-9,17-dione monooxygenase reductase component